MLTSAWCSQPADNTTRFIVSAPKSDQLFIYTIGQKAKLETIIASEGGPGAMCFNKKGDRLYVALKGKGSIAVYQFDTDARPTRISEVSVGANPGYLAIHPNGKFLFSSYYSKGSIAVHRILADGSLSTDSVQTLMTDERAHAIVPDPSGKSVFVPHTRPNSIHQFAFDTKRGLLTPNQPPALKRKENSGPRHLWFHPTLPVAYGSDEQGCSISSYTINPSGLLSLSATLSSLPAAGFTGKRSTSDIEVHPSGKYVYIANRGHNSIAGFQINESTGQLKSIGYTKTEPVPRSFNISNNGKYLVAAGQTSGKIGVFHILSDGNLQRTQTIDLGPSPWWVVFQP